jgi:UDP-glucose 4-epimerase
VLSGTDRILITGGAGLVGSHIADLLVKQFNPEIIILDNFVSGRRENLRWALTHGRVEIVDGDIRDAALVHELMNGVDFVFHQAAIRMSQCAEDPRLAVEVLADGTFNVLEAAALNRVKKVIAASSDSIYGLADEFPTTEDHHPYNNRTLFGAAKAFNESLLRSFHDMYGINYVVLRYFNVYGPRMDIHGGYTEVLIRWMDRLAQRQPCVILGDGTQTKDFIYVEDIARANILAASSSITDEVFNVASGVETSLNELAVTLGRVMGSSIPPEHGPARKTNPVPRRLADTHKTKRMLNFRAQVSLEEGLSRLVSWWERQRALDAAIA